MFTFQKQLILTGKLTESGESFVTYFLPLIVNMCNCSHRIVLKNVNNGDSVFTELILIHGHVENPCESGKLTILANETVSHFRELPEFKHLLALSAGPNEFRLTYCNTAISMVLNYTPKTNPFVVIPLYVVCDGHDGYFQSPDSKSLATARVACQRIDVMLQLVQLVYAEKLNEAQRGRRTFTIGGSCREYLSSLSLDKALKMSEQQLWETLADEIIRREGADAVERRKYVAILGCTRFEGCPHEDNSYETIKRRTRARAAIGGGGLVVFNTGCLYTWPDTVDQVEKAFRNNQPVDMERFADDSNYRRTYGGCFATNLGSLCHELGHAFDLGHTEEGIMGRSFDSTEKLFLPLSAIERRCLPKRSSPGRDSSLATSRMTRVRMNGTVLRDYLKEKECNGIYFAGNCLAILAHHKWFRGEETGMANSKDNESPPCQVSMECRAADATPEKGPRRKDSEKERPLRFSATKLMVKSVHGLRLVELREPQSEMVKHYWELGPGQLGSGGDEKNEAEEEDTEFKLPLTSNSDHAKPWIMFAIDCRGNSLKCSF